MSTEVLTSDSTALVSDGGPPLVRAGLRGFLDLGRFDVIAVIALVLVAFGLRMASPIFPDFLSGGGTVKALGVGYPITAGSGAECTSVPVGPPGVVAGVKVSHVDVSVCGYVFDEIYFPVDAAKDLRQPAESYFDPEPPLAKLLMAPPIAVFGFNSWSWRLSTTIFGSLLVGIMYLVALRLRRDRFFALATALFICFDGLAFVEARTGVIDIIAIFFVALFYYVFLLHWQARTRAQWRTTLYVMAGGARLPVGAKLTSPAASPRTSPDWCPGFVGSPDQDGRRRSCGATRPARKRRSITLPPASSRSRSSWRASLATRPSSTRMCTSSRAATPRWRVSPAARRLSTSRWYTWGRSACPTPSRRSTTSSRSTLPRSDITPRSATAIPTRRCG